MTANISPTLLNEFTFSYTTDHIFLNATGPAQRPSTMTMTGLFNNGLAACCRPSAWAAASIMTPVDFSWIPDISPGTTLTPPYTYKDQLSKIIGSPQHYRGRVLRRRPEE